MKEPENCLGISLGMRRIGIAVGTKDSLLEKQVKGFDDRFNEAKIEKICRMVDRMITLYGVTAIAMKAPGHLRRNKALNATIASLSVLATNRNIPLMLYDITMLENSLVNSRDRKSVVKGKSV